ncbi:MAG TPA: 4Fe-4S binding protein [Firmicutes bacterium]|nr:4Fe-4S binding protein [Bacillota bacterium]
MKELLVISGKGGTGKTTIVGSLAVVAENKVLADCDVDAADLHLILRPQILETHQFYGLPKAKIDAGICTRCGGCLQVCRFGAVKKDYQIDPTRCEGCGVCYHFCPAGAITMVDHCCGHWYISNSPYGPLVHAALGIAEENSGKLVALVREKSRALAKERGAQYILTDGPPGVGCPVIASLASVDLALVVTEPTVAGRHDLDRVLDLTQHFRVPAAVCINKHDLEPGKTRELEEYCRQRGILVLGLVPFRQEVNQAQVQGKPVVEYCRGPAAKAIEQLWEAVREMLDRES